MSFNVYSDNQTNDSTRDSQHCKLLIEHVIADAQRHDAVEFTIPSLAEHFLSRPLKKAARPRGRLLFAQCVWPLEDLAGGGVEREDQLATGADTQRRVLEERSDFGLGEYKRLDELR